MYMNGITNIVLYPQITLSKMYVIDGVFAPVPIGYFIRKASMLFTYHV